MLLSHAPVDERPLWVDSSPSRQAAIGHQNPHPPALGNFSPLACTGLNLLKHGAIVRCELPHCWGLPRFLSALFPIHQPPMSSLISGGTFGTTAHANLMNPMFTQVGAVCATNFPQRTGHLLDDGVRCALNGIEHSSKSIVRNHS
ncbi:hypothetical protein [Pseudomonas sp. NPDC090208]|uniref:hypothetical protein n=1 Tax=Pseudomonas sp. NPDC090208 TaxID=3364478 RepID=UPI0038001DD9